MKPDKKQIQQFVVFGALLLAFIGYLGFQVMPKPAPNATTASASAVVPRHESDVKSQVAETAKNAVVEQPEDAGLTPSGKRDPFAPQLMASLPIERLSIPNVRQRFIPPLVSCRPVPRIGGSMSVGPMPMPMPLPSMGQMANPAYSATSQPSSEPQFKVTGVIRGKKNVAIVRLADERHIVREGDYINGTYKVVSVRDDGVDLVASDRRIRLKMGGVKNAN